VNRHLWRWIPTSLLLLVLAALALLTRGFTSFPRTYYMTGASMAPSVGQGEWFLARSSSGLPGYGDLVLVEHWIDDTLYHVLRRAVALPGDTARMVNGALFVNGRAADWPARIVERRAERPLDGPIPGTIYNWGPVAVGRNSVFVLSDTRDMIGWPDSRFVGAVPVERLVGRYLHHLWRGSVPRRP
jgi:signal peptidase I